MDGKISAIVEVIAYGSRRDPTTRTSALTSRPKTPQACSSDPISTPKPISRPTFVMISPNPVVMALIVPVKPTPVANPR